MVPTRGPMLFSVRGFAPLAIANGADSGAIRFRWPRPLFVTALQCVTRTALVADLAGLTIAVTDETQQQMFFNWQGENVVNLAAAQGLGGLGGPGPLVTPGNGWLALQRPVAAGDQWFITIANISAAPITVAALLFRFEEGQRRAA